MTLLEAMADYLSKQDADTGPLRSLVLASRPGGSGLNVPMKHEKHVGEAVRL